MKICSRKQATRNDLIRNGIIVLATLCFCVIMGETQLLVAEEGAVRKPNIVVILADDMGYGDPKCFNTDSKCVTPNIDRLAREGMMFTDAHTAGAVCVPSRFGLLTGRYPFRQQLNWRQKPVIDEGRATVASLLQSKGYATSMVGKWHLGFADGPNYDYSQPLGGGPFDRGFAQFFGMHASLDITPYFYIRNDRAVLAPTEMIGDSNTPGWSRIQGAFWRGGAISPDFKHDEVLDKFAAETVKEVKRLSGKDAPFFLYMALPAPHTPWLPGEKFQGIGGAGMYSEFVAHVDDVVGRMLSTLDETGAAEKALVLFTSDNGPVWYDADEEKYGHASTGPLRGMKGDAWEGGHRVPFIVRWPGHVKASAKCHDLIGFVDIFATLAEVVSAEIPNSAAEDSVSFYGSLKNGMGKSARQTMVHHHSGSVVRDGSWKLITHLGSGGFSEPRRVKVEQGGPQGQLYNLKQDLGEQNNLWNQEPERVKRMLKMLEIVKNPEAPL